jgi:hypothetical protein
MTATTYLYRIEWDDVRPAKIVHKRPIIAGGMRTAAEARKFAQTAFLGSSSYASAKRIVGVPVVRRVRRIGPDTPAMREKVEAGR